MLYNEILRWQFTLTQFIHYCIQVFVCFFLLNLVIMMMIMIGETNGDNCLCQSPEKWSSKSINQ